MFAKDMAMQLQVHRRSSRPWSVTAILLLTITLTITVDAASLTTDERSSGRAIAESRTFGRIRRLQAMIVPVMFFLGVMKTLLAFLVAISLKTLFVGVSILMINIGLAMAKVIAFFKSKHSYEHHGGYGGWGGGGGGGGGWPDKNIHVHIHNDGFVQHGSLPLEFDHPPTAMQHTAPSVFPTYGPPALNPYHNPTGHRSRSDDISSPVYVTSGADRDEERYPKILVSDRDKLNQIYAEWRQLNRRGR